MTYINQQVDTATVASHPNSYASLDPLGASLLNTFSEESQTIPPLSDSYSVQSIPKPSDTSLVFAQENPVEDSPIPGREKRPCYRVLNDWVKTDDRNFQPGVWYFTTKLEKNGNVHLIHQWICSPLLVNAITRDSHGNHFGRLLSFKPTVGPCREWAMPMELLKGSGDELRGELLSMGVEIDPHNKHLLANYLQSQHPKRQMLCALQVGWVNDSFVLPDQVIGPKAASVIFQSSESAQGEYAVSGTLNEWRSTIATYAINNPILMLAISAAFTVPLLSKCHAEGGGIHLVGDSSTGKTTAIDAACSVWGGTGFKRSWRATSNGLEGAAMLFNDGLLALDEISECDPRQVGEIVYMLGNGTGKQRARRTGSARHIARWLCFVVSSGERTIETSMQEGGYRTKAGQLVRLLDIPANRQWGAWDDIHDFTSGSALSDAIKQAAAKQYGHAGRAFLEKLTRDSRDFGEYLRKIQESNLFLISDGEGQHKRAATRFALIGLAGELATEYGITGWPEGAAITAAATCFALWRTTRGPGNHERHHILEKVRSFIERYGDSRFSNADIRIDADTVAVRDRAGWWREQETYREYLFTAAGLHEATKGFDFKRALDVLAEAGALTTSNSNGERSKSQRFRGCTARVYGINPEKLEVCHGT